MSQTIKKSIGEGFGKGELYAALAYDASDNFGGMKIKALMLNSTGRISFLDANAYIYSSVTTQLDLVATTIKLTGAVTVSGGSFTQGVDGTSAGDFIVYGKASGSYIQYDEDSNDCGRLNVFNSTIRTTMNRSLNECGVAFRTYQDANTGSTDSSTRAVLVECYLNDGITNASATDYAEITGVSSSAYISGVLNGDALCVAGLKGEIRGGGTQTEVKNIAAVSAKYNNAQNPTTGDSCLFWGWSHAGVVDYGLLLEASGSGSLTTGISIDSCATAGISIEGTHTLALGIGTTTALTTATTGRSAIRVESDHSASGYHVPVWSIGQHTGDGTTYGSVYCVRGDVILEGTQTTQSNAQYIVGVHGRARVSGTAYNSSLCVAGVCAQLLAGGTWTAANLVYCLWVDNQLATNPTAGTVAMVGIRQNNNSSTAVVDHCFDIYGPKIANFINFDTCTGTGSFISNSAATGSVKKAKCKIGDTDYYINMYELS